MTDAPDCAAGFATRAISAGQEHDLVRPSVGLDQVADLAAAQVPS